LRQACRYLGLERSNLAYQRKPPTERRVQKEAVIVELSRKHPRYGYRRVHAMVVRGGLSCARRARRRRSEAEDINAVWCVDLVFDATCHGVTLNLLTIVDEASHYCIDIAVGRRMTVRDVVRALDEAVWRHGEPRHLRIDNGGEFIAGVLQRWLKERGIVARLFKPGSPWQNGVNVRKSSRA
jgi:putative transposase